MRLNVFSLTLGFLIGVTVALGRSTPAIVFCVLILSLVLSSASSFVLRQNLKLCDALQDAGLTMLDFSEQILTSTRRIRSLIASSEKGHGTGTLDAKPLAIPELIATVARKGWDNVQN